MNGIRSNDASARRSRWSPATLLGHALVVVAVAAVALSWAPGAFASATVPQTWLPGQCVPQFAAPLPVFGPGYNAALPRVDALRHPALTVSMKETAQQVIPPFVPAPGCPAVNIQPTRVFTYETRDALTGALLGPALWPGVTVETRRGIPTLVKYVNALPSFADGGLVQGLISNDQTIDFSDPLHGGVLPCLGNPFAAPDCGAPYLGPVPAVPHLHGGEVPSMFDGGPQAWFTPNGLEGKSYQSLLNVGPGKAVYLYPNTQEAGTLWFHDHAMGSTRTNVYSGLAAFYLLRDPKNEPQGLPTGAYEIEMAVQDRQFDTNGQLLFPDGSDPACGTLGANDPCWNGPPTNPTVHPFWNPEFVGDVVIVNGAPWPFFKVEPRRYRFRIAAGANARTWNLGFGDAAAGESAPAVYVIGSDDNYLDAPARVASVLISPGERADVIVDFTGFAGKNVTVTNDVPVPYPDGVWPVPHPVTNPDGTVTILPADQPWMGKVMQFRVTEPLRGADGSCDPAAGGCGRPSATVRLATGHGSVAPGVKIDKVRQLVLKEWEGPGGPLAVLVNNTYFDGMMSDSVASEFSASDGVSELPRVGSTELWEIANLTMDAHPMHTHLTQFQILNRQPFLRSEVDDTFGYPGAWASAFGSGPVPLPPACAAGVFCPGYGPPLSYGVPNADGALGGNPAFSPFLVGSPRPPDAWESGWKDTAKAYPGEILRILVRYAPTSSPVKSAKAGKNLYPFDPTKGPGYVWHCHIVDHEDNDMMRPLTVVK